MFNRLKLSLVPGLVAASMIAGPAFAQDGTVELSETSNGGETPAIDAAPAASGGRYPVKYAARPLTLSAMTLRAEGDILFPKRLGLFGAGGDFGVGLEIGAAFGITNELEVGATILPLSLAPDAEFGDIPVYGRFAFLKGNLELGAQLGLTIPTSSDFGLAPGLVGALHFGNGRLDVGALLILQFGDVLGKGVDIPIVGSWNFSDTFFAQVRTGFQIGEFATPYAFTDGLNVPLGVGAFYTIAKGDVPMLDVGATFDWPLYVNSSLPDTLNFDVFVIALSARFHMFL